MRYYIIAGERSGDLHAANLVKSLRETSPDLEARGIGGDYLKDSGVQLFMHYHELSVMGFWEVLKSAAKLRRFLKLCQKDLVAFNPDVLILIDFAGFNLRMATFAKAKQHQNILLHFPKNLGLESKKGLQN